MATYSDPTTSIISTKAPGKVAPGAILAIIAGVLSLITAGGMYAMVISTKNQVTTATQQNAAKTSKLQLYDATATQLTTLTASAKSLHVLYDNQIDWNKVISIVTSHFYSNMVVDSLQINAAGNLIFAGTTPTYTDYAKIYTSLTDTTGAEYFTTAVPNSVSKPETPNGQVTFSFTLTVAPKVLQGIDPANL